MHIVYRSTSREWAVYPCLTAGRIPGCTFSLPDCLSQACLPVCRRSFFFVQAKKKKKNIITIKVFLFPLFALMQKVEPRLTVGQEKNQGQSIAPHDCPCPRTSKIKAFQINFGVSIRTKAPLRDASEILEALYSVLVFL
jgi:hypothetical protein